MVCIKLLFLSCAVISLLELTQPISAVYGSRRRASYTGAAGTVPLLYGRGTVTSYGHGKSNLGYGAVRTGYGVRKTKFVPAGLPGVSKTGYLLSKLNKHAAAAIQSAETAQKATLNAGKHLSLLSHTKNALGNHVAVRQAKIASGYGLPGVHSGLGLAGRHGVGSYGLAGVPGFGYSGATRLGHSGFGYGSQAAYLQPQAAYGGLTSGLIGADRYGLGHADPYSLGHGAGLASGFGLDYAF